MHKQLNEKCQFDIRRVNLMRKFEKILQKISAPYSLWYTIIIQLPGKTDYK